MERESTHHLMSIYYNYTYEEVIGKQLKKGKFWRPPGYIGFRSANILIHRVDLKPGTNPITIFIPGPFGSKKRTQDQSMVWILKLENEFK